MVSYWKWNSLVAGQCRAHLWHDHEDVYESVEVAEVLVFYLVLPPVEHVLHALVSTVDGFTQDEDGGEADYEYSLSEGFKKKWMEFSTIF